MAKDDELLLLYAEERGYTPVWDSEGGLGFIDRESLQRFCSREILGSPLYQGWVSQLLDVDLGPCDKGLALQAAHSVLEPDSFTFEL